ncbi:ABC transporter substrate-binding protein [Ramlibacter humi]|uniref:Twin-arginine translocation pathway signal protein n=1 Tax=Ramlibacter humi TaxID=2530451 RepID=A0A4Z0C8P1_9BURK|nr:ABC transporter substrate-binding protein [Ramlibacter humi]TFZ08046.1 twin-arginine translocation pathway signal protein [Ramlibacter humi]
MPLRDAFALRRRALVVSTAAALTAPAVLAQPGRPGGKPIAVAQLADMSPQQQDVSRDFLVGSRAAWQDINAKGGVHGRPVQHLSLEVDGSAAAVKAALASARDNAACVAFSGTCGDPVAGELVAQLRADSTALAHAAPWLQNSSLDVDERTFPIFAARQEQIGHALKSLTLVGVRDLAAIYATPADWRLYREDVERSSSAIGMKLQSFRAEGNLSKLAQRLNAATPPIVLFVGGTPELIEFTQALEKQPRQRYVIALADVNMQTLQQLGGARNNTAVIATQAVPLVTASMPVVRNYRDTLARLFDEPPSPLSLAGFIAARYTYEVLNDIDGAITRSSVLAAFQRRGALDVGGFRVAFDSRRRSVAFVTQSMLTQDGRLVG